MFDLFLRHHTHTCTHTYTHTHIHTYAYTLTVWSTTFDVVNTVSLPWLTVAVVGVDATGFTDTGVESIYRFVVF